MRQEYIKSLEESVETCLYGGGNYICLGVGKELNIGGFETNIVDADTWGEIADKMAEEEIISNEQFKLTLFDDDDSIKNSCIKFAEENGWTAVYREDYEEESEDF